MSTLEQQTDPLVGTVLQDRYRVVEHIADGAMGAVYKGERLGLKKPVAIKFLHESFVDETQFLQRFEREARAMSRLSHPHCVSVTDFGVQDSPFIVMDYVTGKSLRELLDEVGRLDTGRALDIASQILAGVAHAHGCGIIHRDIKPANVVLTEATGFGDFVRLLDFGLAKLRDPATRGDPSTSFVIVGTPNYMSPEQSRLETVDERSDVYSTGILLFELLTGQKPFYADTTSEILRMQREEPLPRLSDMAPGVPFSKQLEAVVQRAAAKDPNLRFSSAIDFAEALREVPEGQSQSARVTLRPSSVARMGSTDERVMNVALAQTLADDAHEVVLSAADLSYTNVVPRSHERRWTPVFFAIALLMGLAGGAYALYGKSDDQPGIAARSVLDDDDEPVTAAARTPTSTVSPPEGVPDPEESDGRDEEEEDRGLFDFGSGDDEGEEDADEPADEPGDALDALANDVDSVDRDGEEATDEELTGEDLADAADADADALDDAELDFAPDELDEPVAGVTSDHDAVGDRSPARPEPERPATVEVNTIADAKKLIAQGQNEQALRGLQQLARKYPKNAYIPYLIGNLFFDKTYWTDGLKAYETAIKNDGKYRTRTILTNNAIRALSSPSTRGRATRLLVQRVGRSGLPELRRAARADKNPNVRKRSAVLVKRIQRSSSKKRTSKKRTSSRRASKKRTSSRRTSKKRSNKKRSSKKRSNSRRRRPIRRRR